MTERKRKLLRWVGYPVLAWVTFVFMMHFTFPYDSLRDRLVEIMSKDYDVGIAEVSPGLLPGRVRLKGITLTTRPTAESEKPRTLFIERVDLAIGWLALVGKSVSIDVRADLGEGSIAGNFTTSAKRTAVDFRTDGLSLETVPGIAVVTGGAPFKGPLQARIRLELPEGKWSQASGNIELGCEDCTIGDGVTKVKSPVTSGPANAFSDQGITLPRIRLGKFVAKIDIKQGAACIVELTSKSADGELSVDGGLKLTDALRDLQAQLYAKIKFSDEFKKASARNQDFEILMTTGARQPDGWATFQIKGPLMSTRWLGAHAAPPPMKECTGIAAPAPPPPPPPRVAGGGRSPMAPPAAPTPAPTAPPPPGGMRPPTATATPTPPPPAPPPAAGVVPPAEPPPVTPPPNGEVIVQQQPVAEPPPPPQPEPPVAAPVPEPQPQQPEPQPEPPPPPGAELPAPTQQI
jgi:type II secretion system protein N